MEPGKRILVDLSFAETAVRETLQIEVERQSSRNDHGSSALHIVEDCGKDLHRKGLRPRKKQNRNLPDVRLLKIPEGEDLFPGPGRQIIRTGHVVPVRAVEVNRIGKDSEGGPLRVDSQFLQRGRNNRPGKIGGEGGGGVADLRDPDRLPAVIALHQIPKILNPAAELRFRKIFPLIRMKVHDVETAAGSGAQRSLHERKRILKVGYAGEEDGRIRLDGTDDLRGLFQEGGVVFRIRPGSPRPVAVRLVDDLVIVDVVPVAPDHGFDVAFPGVHLLERGLSVRGKVAAEDRNRPEAEFPRLRDDGIPFGEVPLPRSRFDLRPVQIGPEEPDSGLFHALEFRDSLLGGHPVQMGADSVRRGVGVGFDVSGGKKSAGKKEKSAECFSVHIV